MERVNYLILGAGPAGLTLANRLKELGETSFLVLEKEAEAGGLCRSVMVVPTSPGCPPARPVPLSRLGHCTPP